jgi:SAM-dependent methyltransferase
MTDTRLDRLWQSRELADRFVSGVRRAIPGGALQLEVMLRMIEANARPVERFLDLGCGSGTLGAAVLQQHPDATGVFADFSEPMIKSARENLAAFPNAVFAAADYAEPDWVDPVAAHGPFDAVVSGFSIHHQPDENKRRVYADILALLVPGGIFVHMEHVKPTSELAHQLFEDHFVENLYEGEVASGGTRSRDELRTEFVNREDKEANILAPVDKQLDWMRELGYIDVDCHLRIYELAVFGGRKPE